MLNILYDYRDFYDYAKRVKYNFTGKEVTRNMLYKRIKIEDAYSNNIKRENIYKTGV